VNLATVEMGLSLSKGPYFAFYKRDS